MGVSVIVLAAGEGRRMRSARPKVLADLAGQPLLGHVLARVEPLAAERVRVVLGHGADAVRAVLPDGVEPRIQPRQRGTGDAVACALDDIPESDCVLVLYGDVPLVQETTMCALLDAARDAECVLLTIEAEDPTGYGRIVRDADGRVARIVEEKDADANERALREINTGLLAMPAGALARHVADLDCDNAQGEYYLTDVVARVRAEGGRVEAVHPEYDWEVQGVNSRVQLAELERLARERLNMRLPDFERAEIVVLQ